MPNIDKHSAGNVSWTDLGTTDPEAAKQYYGALFGWNLHDDPMGEGMVYTRLLAGDRDVGALFPQRPEEKQMGIPPHWNTYVTVDDVDQTTPKAEKLGGKVLSPPFDVFDVGRMSIVQDPTGGVLCLWQAKKHIGARIMHEPNTLTWAELMTSNVDAAGKFYIGLLGWKAEADKGGYTQFSAGGQPVAGMMGFTPDMPKMPSHWRVYFAVADVDATVAKSTSLGGKTHFGPMDIPEVGRFAILADPQGAAFGVIKLARK